MKRLIEARRRDDDDWILCELTNQHKAGFPMVEIDGQHYRPGEVVSIRGVDETDDTRWLLERAKEEGFKVE